MCVKGIQTPSTAIEQWVNPADAAVLVLFTVHKSVKYELVYPRGGSIYVTDVKAKGYELDHRFPGQSYAGAHKTCVGMDKQIAPIGTCRGSIEILQICAQFGHIRVVLNDVKLIMRLFKSVLLRDGQVPADNPKQGCREAEN